MSVLCLLRRIFGYGLRKRILHSSKRCFMSGLRRKYTILVDTSISQQFYCHVWNMDFIDSCCVLVVGRTLEFFLTNCRPIIRSHFLFSPFPVYPSSQSSSLSTPTVGSHIKDWKDLGGTEVRQRGRVKPLPFQIDKVTSCLTLVLKRCVETKPDFFFTPRVVKIICNFSPSCPLTTCS